MNDEQKKHVAIFRFRVISRDVTVFFMVGLFF